MSLQRRLLPSMSALAAFVSVARSGSHTQAAEELNVTQGAVSRQIKALEDFLGVKLFTRSSRQIVLTSAGQLYAKDINAALGRIGTATLTIMSGLRGGVLNFAILPAFGNRWLVPQIPAFLSLHPEITINFYTRYYQPVDFNKEDLDLAIYIGNGPLPGVVADFLFFDEMQPVCSPDFLRRHPVREPSDLMSLPLLHEATRPQAWPAWFSENQVGGTPSAGLRIEQFTIVAQAAVAGMGVAMIPTFLVEPELRRGELVIAYDAPLRSNKAYHLIHPEEKSSAPHLQVFRNWLMDIVKETPVMRANLSQ